MAPSSRPRRSEPRLDSPKGLRTSFVPWMGAPSDRFGRFTEAIARGMGTPWFLFFLSVFCLAWLTYNVIAPVDIISHTADYFKLSMDDLYGASRSQAIATARQIAMYLCRELTNLSLPKIGQLFGNRDHTTVMYANKKISELMKERRSIYNQVTELTSRIKQNHRYNKN